MFLNNLKIKILLILISKYTNKINLLFKPIVPSKLIKAGFLLASGLSGMSVTR